jgi:hypothetical protein
MTRASLIVLVMLAAGGCSRRSQRARDVDGARSVAVASPRPLLPRYHGGPDFALAFFDDCHCEIDGEHSSRWRRRYTFDGAQISIDNMPSMGVQPDGSLVETGARDAGWWDRLADAGRWFPVDDRGFDRRPQAAPRFPEACRRPARDRR